MLSGSHSPEDTLTRTPTSSDANVEPSTIQTQPLPPPAPSQGTDNAHDDDNVSSKRKINKQKSSSSSSERHDSPQEIAEGNCLVAKGEKSDGKINTPKKRFFDLKRTAESASHRIQSISPSRFALSLTPKLRRKSAANHKLSQLEQRSNLFIRDGSERKINKPEEASTSVVMATPAKHQHDPAEGKKSSLIPSFNFRIPSASTANKSDGNFAKSGTNLKNLCKNFSTEVKSEKPPALAFPNYEEIDIPNEVEDENNAERKNLITNAPDVPNDNRTDSPTAIIPSKFSPEKQRKVDEEKDDEEFNSIEGCGGATTTQPEYNSNRFKNIPVRPRKGQVPHMENYCLFDPSVDFCNEKDLRRKNFPTQSTAAAFSFPPQNFRNFHVAKEVVCERQLVYDINEHDERLAHHNYYEIDPELLEQDEAFDRNRIELKSDHVGASNITQTSSGSSSSGDYPSLFNSVIETTPSSTVTIESTDESNAYGKLSNDANHASDAINQANVVLVDDENVITISSIVTATGAKKKPPQFDRIVKQMARNSTDNANQQPTIEGGKSTKINLPFYNETLSFDPLKSSHSLPQLQNITVRQQQIADGDYHIEINNRTTIQLRRSGVRRVRPLSSDSLDSGFTTPSPPSEVPRSQHPLSGDNKQVDNLNSDTKAPVKSGESTVLTQCDNIQQLIEVSDD